MQEMYHALIMAVKAKRLERAFSTKIEPEIEDRLRSELGE